MNNFAFTTVDFIVIGIVLLSLILGLVRGFVREVLSLAGFAFSMWLSYRYSGDLSIAWLTSLPGGDTGRLALAFLAIFIGTWFVTKILSSLITRAIASAGLSFFDRLLGSAFGAIRGILIVVVLSTLAALTNLPSSHEWKDALTRPAVEMAVSVVRSWLPPDWSQKLSEATDIRQR
jgi:membrane protein required for colicin V production